jgi:hypothetical protein
VARHAPVAYDRFTVVAGEELSLSRRAFAYALRLPYRSPHLGLVAVRGAGLTGPAALESLGVWIGRRSELSHVDFVCKRAGKEDFDVLKLFAGTLVVLSLAAVGANAAETGTKTMPDSSVYPPRTHRPVYNWARPHHHHYCYLPSSRCGNNHRVTN